MRASRRLRRADSFGAFVPGPRTIRLPTGTGNLRGYSFAVKDVIAVAGTRTGSGNPDWARTHPPEVASAPVVTALLASGATMAGKTVCDELAFSLEGANAHYGTPRNPRAPARLPGGSSSGSAVAVAAGIVDGALGTDTGGSIRTPSSFCGIFGIRPTHGRIPTAGVTPLAPSYDTVGWFATDGPTLERFGRALGMRLGVRAPREYVLVADAWDLVEPRSTDALRAAAERLGIRGEVRIYDGDPDAWYEAYRVLQGAEIRAQHGAWIERAHPRFGPRTAERFDALRRLTRSEVDTQVRFRRSVARTIRRLVRHGRALVLPASPCIALSRRRSLAARAAFYRRALAISSVAGHAGVPEVVLPLAQADGCPIGLGVIAAPNADESLLALAASDRVARWVRGADPAR